MPKFFLACVAAVLCGGAAFAQAGVCRECEAHAAKQRPAITAAVSAVVQHTAERVADRPQPVRQFVRRLFGRRGCR